MVRLSSVLFLCIAIAALPGCESLKDFKAKHIDSPKDASLAPQLVAEPDQVSAMLADAANRASNALQTLAAVEQSRTPAVAVAPISDAPSELMRVMSVSWAGPVAPITKAIADRAEYSFSIIGAQPAIPVVVMVDAETKPVIEILRDIGLQLGKRGDVRVDANLKTVELHFAPNTGMGAGL